MELISYRSNL